MGRRIEVFSDSRCGVIQGRIMHCRWFALVQSEPTDYGLNPRTLTKGGGRVSRLCVYIPGKNPKRVAEYSRGWIGLKYDYIDLVEELVGYLEMRYSLRLIKNVHGASEQCITHDSRNPHSNIE
jgi:hypothetical protein